MDRTRLVVLAIVGMLSSACGGGGGGGGGTSPPPPPPPPPPTTAYSDVTASSGIDYEFGYRLPPPSGEVHLFATNGAAAADYDNDGDIDIFVARGDVGGNLLYRNNGFGVFTDVAESAGVAFTYPPSENYRLTGPAFADMNGDGHLDLFIAGLFGDPSFIYQNDGDGTFTNVTTGSGIDTMGAEHNITASFGDYDLDGDLDMFIGHWGTDRDMMNPGDTEHLWRNDTVGIGGTIQFTSVSVAAGISPSILTLPDPLVPARPHDTTFTSSFARINDDLYPDLLVVADGNQSMVFLNNADGSGTFTNVTDVDVITDSSGMGNGVGDYDDDGDLDWFVTSIHDIDGSAPPNPDRTGNRLYRNDGGGVFVDVTDAAGVINGAWGWGACFLDFENDGDLDIYHTNGYRDEFADDVSRAFVSAGDGTFNERAVSMGLGDNESGRGAICADFDNDGDADVFQTHRGSPVSATLWRNNQTGNNYLKVALTGTAPNTFAAGARISATVGSQTMMREIIIGNNFLSQNPTLQIFGLGSETQVDELTVEWPDGQEVSYGAYTAGQTVTLTQP